ncbi:MAG: exodeoxyribonuclease VII large subunit [Magnetococcales bacterium]|nr:exodeoxyribonuclease VII large subunit [Magnetococcales bacterium]
MTSVSLIQDSWLSVTELNEQIRDLLEEGLPFIRVEAEISDLRAPPSGHLYFTLIDGASRIRAVVWRTTRRRLSNEPRSGERVRVTGRLVVYAPRGEYQIVVEGMKPVGSGGERQRLLLLHARLTAEGLFDEANKKTLPLLPQAIGVVTSKSGAALHDITRVLDDRFPNYHLIFSPALVQGDHAPEEIAAALDRLVEDGRSQVIICGRGGGSAEDLSVFNSEVVVRAIARCPIPIISAVGHEVDQTLADLAADLRAATPSAAAERIVPEKRLLRDRLATLQRQLTQAISQKLQRQHNQLAATRKALVHPSQKINQARLRCDELTQRLYEAARTGYSTPKKELNELTTRLFSWSESRYFTLHKIRLDHCFQQLQQNGRRLPQQKRERHDTLLGRLQAISPRGVLQRGYAIIQDDQGHVLMDCSAVKAGETIHAQLAHGSLTATLTHTKE